MIAYFFAFVKSLFKSKQASGIVKSKLRCIIYTVLKSTPKGVICLNLNLFDDMGGFILHEKENTYMNTNISEKSDSNDTGGITRFPKNTPLAMAYVPYQQWGEVYDSSDALENGTLFPELNYPFGKGGER